jgi:hypothetical protein
MEVVGTIALVYDHSVGDLASRLTDLQHDHYRSIVSTLHVHVDEHNCLEVLVVRGRQSAVRRISDALIGTRGVRQGKLIINSDVAARRSGAHARGPRADAHPHAHGSGAARRRRHPPAGARRQTPRTRDPSTPD